MTLTDAATLGLADRVETFRRRRSPNPDEVSRAFWGEHHAVVTSWLRPCSIAALTGTDPAMGAVTPLDASTRENAAGSRPPD